MSAQQDPTSSHSNPELQAIEMELLTMGGPECGAMPDSFKVSGPARSILRRFARAAGVDTHIVSGNQGFDTLSADDLRRLYNDRVLPSELNRTYKSLRDTKASNEPSPLGLVPGTQLDPPTVAATPRAAPMFAPTHAPAPTKSQDVPATGTGDLAADAARAIAALMASNQPGAAELDEARVIALVKEHSARPTHHVVEVRSATGTTTIADAHMNMADCLDAIQSAPGVYMPGPAGSGKSTIGKHMAKALNVPFYFENALQSQYALTGYQDAHGNYVTTDFRRAYENGGLFLFDEIDASNPGACVWFNGAVAGDCATFPDGLVEKHPDFYCAAAANTFGNGGDRLYVGRNQLDAATLDRFVAVVIDYDPAIESAMANGNSQWMAKVQKIRAAVAALKIRAVVTPRATMAGAALIARGWTEEKTMQATIWKGLEADTVAKIKTEAGV